MPNRYYCRLSVLAGREVLRILGRERLRSDEPTERDIEPVREVLEAGRRKAKLKVLRARRRVRCILCR